MNADPIGFISILMLGKRYHREGIWAAPDSWFVTGGSVGLTLDEKVELYLRLWTPQCGDRLEWVMMMMMTMMMMMGGCI